MLKTFKRKQNTDTMNISFLTSDKLANLIWMLEQHYSGVLSNNLSASVLYKEVIIFITASFTA